MQPLVTQSLSGEVSGMSVLEPILDQQEIASCRHFSCSHSSGLCGDGGGEGVALAAHIHAA